MLIIKDVPRGNEVTFTFNFYDANNNATYPANAQVSICYFVERVQTFANVALTNQATANGSNAWVGQWSSSGVDTGMVQWSVAGGGVVKDGSFRITANEANDY